MKLEIIIVIALLCVMTACTKPIVQRCNDTCTAPSDVYANNGFTVDSVCKEGSTERNQCITRRAIGMISVEDRTHNPINDALDECMKITPDPVYTKVNPEKQDCFTQVAFARAFLYKQNPIPQNDVYVRQAVEICTDNRMFNTRWQLAPRNQCLTLIAETVKEYYDSDGKMVTQRITTPSGTVIEEPVPNPLAVSICENDVDDSWLADTFAHLGKDQAKKTCLEKVKDLKNPFDSADCALAILLLCTIPMLALVMSRD